MIVVDIFSRMQALVPQFESIASISNIRKPILLQSN